MDLEKVNKLLDKILIGAKIWFVCCLAVSLGVFGYLAYNHAGTDDNRGLYAPNALHRIADPSQPLKVEPLGIEKAIKAAAQSSAHQSIYLNGKEVIVVPVPVSVPERPKDKELLRIGNQELTRVIEKKDHVECPACPIPK